jgi:cbb3-type cytochrome oxidase cytochrome c subunit
MEKHLRKANEAVSEQIRALRREVEREFGMLSRAASRLLGPLLLWASRREAKRLARGLVYEPPTILERHNWGET